MWLTAVLACGMWGLEYDSTWCLAMAEICVAEEEANKHVVILREFDPNRMIINRASHTHKLQLYSRLTHKQQRHVY